MPKDKLAGWFPGWEAVLAQAPVPSEPRAWTWATVERFLADCAQRGEGVSLAAAWAFLDRKVLRWWPEPRELAGWKERLDWFFREGRKGSGSSGEGFEAGGG